MGVTVFSGVCGVLGVVVEGVVVGCSGLLGYETVGSTGFEGYTGSCGF